MSSDLPYDLRHGDCREVMATMAAESIDAIVSDPPYGLSFMGKEWDHGVPGEPFWAEALRVAKPGAHLVAFGGSRTFHRLTCAVEDAGWEIRDVLMWLYGSGFPKSLDVSKAMTKNADADTVKTIKLWLAAAFDACGKSKAQINRECGFTASDYLKTEAGNDAGGRATWHMLLPYGEKWARLKSVVGFGCEFDDEIERYGLVMSRRSAPKESRGIYGEFSGNVSDYHLTDAARQWSGWGTALKPAYEPIILARKPLRGTVARNVQTYGTGAVNVDGCRIATDGGSPAAKRRESARKSGNAPMSNATAAESEAAGRIGRRGSSDVYCSERPSESIGRWPANVLLDEAAASVLDAQTGELASGARAPGVRSGMGFNGANGDGGPGLAASVGGASRFFFVARSGSSTHNVEEQGGQPCGDGLTEAESTSAGKMEADRSDSLHIDGCGSKQTDLFQTGTKSTTSTKTRSTTDSKTSSVSPPSGMTTTTSGNEKTTGLSMESSNAGASDAGSTGRSETSAAEGPGRGRGIAPPASAITSESGAPPTESTTPPTCAPIESASSSRFFYTSKASAKDRGREEHGNDHPTVKPTDVMRWLCRLVAPPGGLILDPFMGSGSTGVAAVAEGFRFVGIDIERHHVDIAERRLKHAARQPAIFGLAS